jgi:hypothetical protein
MFDRFRKEAPGTDVAVLNPAKCEADRTDLNRLLLWLQSNYGRPHIHCHEDGSWSCSCEMNTNIKGASSKIRSDYNLRSPLAAAQQCLDRIEAAFG